MSTVKEKIFDAIYQKVSGVSFVEIERAVPEIAGDCSLGNEEFNLVFWDGLSEEACTAFRELMLEDKIKMQSTPVLVYMVDGKALTLPIAKSERVYKKPHWAPVEFSVKR